MPDIFDSLTIETPKRDVFDTLETTPKGDIFDQVDVTTATRKFKNTPYVFGGNKGTAGTDCSGMACDVFKKFGIDLPRTAAEQFSNPLARTIKPDVTAMKPGDAIYFKDTGGRKGITHVAVYLGDGKYGAMSGKKSGYKEGVIGDALWQKNLAGVKRFLADAPQAGNQSDVDAVMNSLPKKGSKAPNPLVPSGMAFGFEQPKLTQEQELRVKYFNNRTDKSEPNKVAVALAKNPNDLKALEQLNRFTSPIVKTLTLQKADEYAKEDADIRDTEIYAPPSGPGGLPTMRKKSTGQKYVVETHKPSEALAQVFRGQEGAKMLQETPGFLPAAEKFLYSMADPESVGLAIGTGGIAAVAPKLIPLISAGFATAAGVGAKQKWDAGDRGGALFDAMLAGLAGLHATKSVAEPLAAAKSFGKNFKIDEPYSRTEVMNTRAPRKEDAFSVGIGLSPREQRRMARTAGEKPIVRVKMPPATPKTSNGIGATVVPAPEPGVDPAATDQTHTTVQPKPTPDVAAPLSPATAPVQEGVAVRPSATGLANQVQAREAEANILSKVEATKGKSAEEWQAIGREKINTDADFEGLAEKVAKGEIELTGERVGVLLEGKRRLVKAANDAAELAESNPTKETQAAYSTARQRLDDYVTNVQTGKGRWSDVGRALQAGTDLDTGNFAEVLTEAKRRGVPVNEKTLKDLSAQVAAKDAEIAAHQARIAELEAAGQTPQQARSTVRGERKAARVKALDDEFDQLYAKWTQARKPGKPMSKQQGAVNIPTDQISIAYKMARNRVQKLGIKMEDAIGHVYEHLKPDMSLDDFRTALLTQTKKVKVQQQAQNRKLEAVYGLPKGEGRGKGVTDSELENLRAERDYWSRRIQQSLRPPKPLLSRAANAIRGLTLGSDVGTLTRQGLPVWGRVLTGDMSAPKATGQALKVAFSEPAMRRLELQRLEERLPDGRLMAAVEKKHGLRISDRVLDPEEMGVGAFLAKRIPTVGPVLERFQHTFINEARRYMFRQGLNRMKPEQLDNWAKFINTVTGRGNIKQVPELANVVMTSVNYESSRWGTLAEIAKSPRELVRAVAKRDPVAIEKVKTLGGTAALIYLTFKGAEMAGYKTSYDPSSPDFMKLRRGNDVWDISAGLAPRARDIYLIYLAAWYPSYRDSLRNETGKIVTRTFSPGITTPAYQASYAAQRRDGVKEADIKNPITGMKVDEQDKSLWALAPLIAQSANQAYTEEGAGSAAWAGVREFLGSGVSRYPERGSNGKTSQAKQPKSEADKMMRKLMPKPPKPIRVLR